MRHRKKTKRLGRKSAHRKATLKSMATALFLKESIRTTKTKAKVAQSYIEGIISAARDNTPQSKRYVFGLIRNKKLINVLFNDIAPRFKTRPGGYTRVIPLYPRRGDGSPMAILELVEKKPAPTPKKAKAKKETSKKEEIKKIEKPKAKKEEVKKPEKTPVATETIKEIKEETRKEQIKKEDKKIKKGGFFKNIKHYFRGKKP